MIETFHPVCEEPDIPQFPVGAIPSLSSVWQWFPQGAVSSTGSELIPPS